MGTVTGKSLVVFILFAVFIARATGIELIRWADCSFERGSCAWKVNRNSSSFWEISTSNRDPFGNAANGGHYTFVNLTGYKIGASAEMFSPQVGINGVICMRLFVNALMTTLAVLKVKLIHGFGQINAIKKDQFKYKSWECLHFKLEVKDTTKGTRLFYCWNTRRFKQSVRCRIIAIDMEYHGATTGILGVDYIQLFNETMCDEPDCVDWSVNALDTRFAVDFQQPRPNVEQTHTPIVTTMNARSSTNTEPSTNTESFFNEQTNNQALTMWLPLYVGIPVGVVFVITLLVIGICCYRLHKLKLKRKIGKHKVSEIQSNIGGDYTTRELPGLHYTYVDNEVYTELTPNESDGNKDYITVIDTPPVPPFYIEILKSQKDVAHSKTDSYLEPCEVPRT